MAKRVMLDPSARPMSSLEAAVKHPDIEIVVNPINRKITINHPSVASMTGSTAARKAIENEPSQT